MLFLFIELQPMFSVLQKQREKNAISFLVELLIVMW